MTQHYCTGAEQHLLVRCGLVATHIGWIVATVLAIKAEDAPLTILAMGTILFSCSFHLTGKRFLELIDIGYAVAAMIVNIALLVLAQATLREWVLCSLVAVFASVIYVVSASQQKYPHCHAYASWHAVWHIVASLTTVLIYGIYLGFWRF